MRDLTRLFFVSAVFAKRAFHQRPASLACGWVALMIAVGSGPLQAATGVAAWSAAANSATELKTQGDVKPEALAVDIGSLRETHSVITLRGTGSTLDLPLQVDPTGKSLLLELQEIHVRRPAVFGYSVWVNGRAVYFRTYEELAAGPVSAWIRVPADLAPDGKVELRLRCEGEAPFSIGRIWLYGDFDALAKAEGTYQPLAVMENPGVLLPLTVAKGTEVQQGSKARKQSVEKDAEAAPALTKLFAGSGYATGIHTNVSYAAKTSDEIQNQIDEDLRRVVEHGFQHQISFNGTEWGHHPNGMDGLGGYFSDLRYSKIKYNPITKEYRPTWPGTPGGTTWPTWNEPQLNLFLDYRLAKAAAYYRQRRDFLLARGKDVPPTVINLEWGLSVGDFHDATIAAARRDGVDLKPEDGYNDVEKRWVFDNLCRTTQRFSAAAVAGLGRDPVVIDRGTAHLPEQQLADRMVFQTFADPIGPYFEDRWAGWQMAVGPLSWAAGEFLPHLPAAFSDYVAARGMLTASNMERQGLPTLDFFGLLYRRGFHQVTPINARSGDAEKLLAETAGLEAAAAEPALHVDRKLFDVQFRKTVPLVADATLVSFENVEVADNSGTPYDRVTIREPGKPGKLLYRIVNSVAVDQPVQFSMIGKLDKKSGPSITIAIGDSPQALTKVATITADSLKTMNHYTWRQTGHVDLGERTRGRKVFFMELTLADSAKGVSIDRFNVSSVWPKPSGPVIGETFTAREQRTQRLWMQDRAIFERAASGIPGERLGTLIEQTRSSSLWRTGYRSLQAEQASVLPARYAVRGYGQLAPHSLSVTLPTPDDVALIELFEPKPGALIEFAVVVEQPFTAKFEITLPPGAGPQRVVRVGDNRFRVIAGSDSANNGQSTKDRFMVSLQLTPPAKHRPLPAKLSGLVIKRDTKGLLIDTQHPDLWMDNPIFIPVNAAATFARQRTGVKAPPLPARPEPRDYVELTLNGAGEVMTVVASYGKTNGRIKKFFPPQAKGELNNGIILLEDGQRFEFSNMWGKTDIKVPPLKPFIRQNTNEQLAAAFKTGRAVDISYIPALVPGRLPRIEKIAPSAP